MPRNVSQSLRQNSEPSRRFTLLVNSAEPSTQEFSADGVTKASGLEVLLARLDIDPALTAAMGDGTNDIEMLMWAGHGVSMAKVIDTGFNWYDKKNIYDADIAVNLYE